MDSAIGFGKAALQHFSFEPGWRNLNHGSFGCCPVSIKEKQRRYQDMSDAKPDHFIRYQYPPLLDQSRAAAAELLNAPVESTVLVQNATVATNTVFRNLRWADDGKDVILTFSTLYEAVAKTADYIVDYFQGNVTHRQIELGYPLEDDEIIEIFRSVVKDVESEKKRVKICVFDAVSSRPGVVFPWQEMVKACKELGILSLVDGAQGVGMVPIDLSTNDPDFFVTNCHKWLLTPRGCAIFYVPIRNQHLLPTTLATSHGYVPKLNTRTSPLPPNSKSNFLNSFEFVGTLDNSQYLVLSDTIAWRKRLGGEQKIMDYLWTLNKTGSKIIADALGTVVMNNKANTLLNCAMANVALPIWVGVVNADAPSQTTVAEANADTALQWLHVTLMNDYKTFLPFFIHGGRYWLRISAQVYLDEDDYRWAASVLRTLCDRVAEGEYLH